jgi:cell division protein FtsN
VTLQQWPHQERRLERKQIVLLLCLILAVALGSFGLGVLVGRTNGRDSGSTLSLAIPPERLPVATADLSPPASPQPAPAAPASKGADLTFYENLPKGEQPPLGSGINRPPAEGLEGPSADGMKPSAAPDQAASAAPEKSPASPSSPPQPAVAGSGSYLVQVASFSRPDEAGLLQGRLMKKGLAAYVQQADLGTKGVWYRVFVGPLNDAAAAERVVARLKAEEKLSAIVRKR